MHALDVIWGNLCESLPPDLPKLDQIFIRSSTLIWLVQSSSTLLQGSLHFAMLNIDRSHQAVVLYYLICDGATYLIALGYLPINQNTILRPTER